MKTLISIYFFLNIIYGAPELIIGERRIEPGIVFIFEGAVRDHIMPQGFHLDENQTNVHIEARVNWDEINTPKGAPSGGFVPYLHITAIVKNQKTGMQTFVDLVPHINLIDNFHYARNISLPGSIYDFYSVTFNVLKPTYIDLAIHRDWESKFKNKLLEDCIFKYKDVYFAEICKATRN